MVEITGDELSYFSKFEQITKVMPVDFVSSEDTLIFLVAAPQLGRAIGRKGINISRLGNIFRKRVIIIANSDNLEEFIRNFFSNITVHAVEIRDIMGESAVLITVEEKDRGIAIGRNGERIKIAKTFLKKKFNATLHLRTKRSSF